MITLTKQNDVCFHYRIPIQRCLLHLMLTEVICIQCMCHMQALV